MTCSCPTNSPGISVTASLGVWLVLETKPLAVWRQDARRKSIAASQGAGESESQE